MTLRPVIHPRDITPTLDSAWRLMPWLPRAVATLFVGRESLDSARSALASGEPEIAASILADHYRLKDHVDARYQIPWEVASNVFETGIKRASRRRVRTPGERAYHTPVAELLEWLGYVDGCDEARPPDRSPPVGADRAIPESDAGNERNTEYINAWCGVAYDRGLLLGLAERQLRDQDGLGDLRNIVEQEIYSPPANDEDWGVRRHILRQRLGAFVAEASVDEQIPSSMCARRLLRHVERKWATDRIIIESPGGNPSPQSLLILLRFNADQMRAAAPSTRSRLIRERQAAYLLAACVGLSPEAVNRAVAPFESRVPMSEMLSEKSVLPGVGRQNQRLLAALSRLPSSSGILSLTWARETPEPDTSRDVVALSFNLHRISEAAIYLNDMTSGAKAAAEYLTEWSPAAPLWETSPQSATGGSQTDPWARAVAARAKEINAARGAAAFLEVMDIEGARHMRSECAIARLAPPSHLPTVEKWAQAYLKESETAEGFEQETLIARFRLLTGALDIRASRRAYAALMKAQTNDRPPYMDASAITGRSRWIAQARDRALGSLPSVSTWDNRVRERVAVEAVQLLASELKVIAIASTPHHTYSDES